MVVMPPLKVPCKYGDDILTTNNTYISLLPTGCYDTPDGYYFISGNPNKKCKSDHVCQCVKPKAFSVLTSHRLKSTSTQKLWMLDHQQWQPIPPQTRLRTTPYHLALAPPHPQSSRLPAWQVHNRDEQSDDTSEPSVLSFAAPITRGSAKHIQPHHQSHCSISIKAGAPTYVQS